MGKLLVELNDSVHLAFKRYCLDKRVSMKTEITNYILAVIKSDQNITTDDVVKSLLVKEEKAKQEEIEVKTCELRKSQWYIAELDLKNLRVSREFNRIKALNDKIKVMEELNDREKMDLLLRECIDYKKKNWKKWSRRGISLKIRLQIPNFILESYQDIHIYKSYWEKIRENFVPKGN